MASAVGGELLDVEVIPRQEHWDEGFALGNTVTFLHRFSNSINLFIWKKCLTETKGKRSHGIAGGAQLENALGDRGNVFDGSDSTYFTIPTSQKLRNSSHHSKTARVSAGL